MRRLLGLFSLVGMLFSFLPGCFQAEAQSKGSIELGGVMWTDSLEHAQAASAQTGKPILWFDMIGRLDETWC